MLYFLIMLPKIKLSNRMCTIISGSALKLKSLIVKNCPKLSASFPLYPTGFIDRQIGRQADRERETDRQADHGWILTNVHIESGESTGVVDPPTPWAVWYVPWATLANSRQDFSAILAKQHWRLMFYPKLQSTRKIILFTLKIEFSQLCFFI